MSAFKDVSTYVYDSRDQAKEDVRPCNATCGGNGKVLRRPVEAKNDPLHVHCGWEAYPDSWSDCTGPPCSTTTTTTPPTVTPKTPPPPMETWKIAVIAIA